MIPVQDKARAAMLRGDQAGEFGATRIYAGQSAVMGSRHPVARAIARMAAQEDRHRRHFDAMLAERRVRPTLLTPLWHVAGFALGAATALIGPEAAMACTAAVETEIDRHYGDQLDQLGDGDPELTHAITEFRAAIQKNERLYAVYGELAELLLSRGESEEADRLYRRVIRARLSTVVGGDPARLPHGDSRLPADMNAARRVRVAKEYRR